MIFIPTTLSGVYIVEPELHQDDRGVFARTFCVREFQAQGLAKDFEQCSISASRLRGTLRGMHYQPHPACEVKLVRCTSGAVYEVVVDLRPESPTYLQHLGVELTPQNRRAVYIPEMCANGLQTLADQSEVFYHISGLYVPGKLTGVRFDDPKLGLQWPLPVSMINERDRNWPLLP
jgi:dTDP-4-dehydrorhamnose 3,5-epimerase